MSELMRAILIMTITGSLLAALLFTLKPLLRDRLPKSAQYYLWLVVVAALLVPVSRIVTLPGGSAAPLVAAPDRVVERFVITSEEELTRLTHSMPTQSEVDDGQYRAVLNQIQSPISGAVTVLVVIYPFGILAVLMYIVISNGIFLKLLRRHNVLTDMDGRIPVYRNALASTPMLIGMFKPAIVLPDKEYTDEQLEAVL
ncbi:MAG: hypothetical protein LBC26_07160, partial [Oscillospiraceae bacterium]|nr:hypothetical protein [Oscillospiraceae bacterium]